MSGAADPASAAPAQRGVDLRRPASRPCHQLPRRRQRVHAQHRQPGTRGDALRLRAGRGAVVHAVSRRAADRTLPASERRGGERLSAAAGDAHRRARLRRRGLPHRLRRQVAPGRHQRPRPLRATRAAGRVSLLDGQRRRQQPARVLRVRHRQRDAGATARLRDRCLERPADRASAHPRRRCRTRRPARRRCGRPLRGRLSAVLRRAVGAAAARAQHTPHQSCLRAPRACTRRRSVCGAMCPTCRGSAIAPGSDWPATTP